MLTFEMSAEQMVRLVLAFDRSAPPLVGLKDALGMILAVACLLTCLQFKRSM